MAITILDVLIARMDAAGETAVDGYSGKNFEDHNLVMMGGCYSCHASLAAYNAYPDKIQKHWACKDCLQEGYESVADFEAEYSADENESSEETE